MQTLIIEHTDHETSKVFKQMAKVLGLTVKVKEETPSYNAELVAKIKQARQEKINGELKRVNPKNVWETIL